MSSEIVGADDRPFRGDEGESSRCAGAVVADARDVIVSRWLAWEFDHSDLVIAGEGVYTRWLQ